MAFDFKEWYDRNGAKLNAQRRAKYHSDPAYKERVRRLNRESKARRKAEMAAQGLVREPSPRIVLQKVVDLRTGQPAPAGEYCTIGTLAEELGCSASSIRVWTRDGKIPQSPFRVETDLDGTWLYDAELKSRIRQAIEASGRMPLRSLYGDEVWAYVQPKRGQPRLEKFLNATGLARRLGRGVATLQVMEQTGKLPRTPFRMSAASNGKRLYLESMVEVVEKAWKARNRAIRGEAAWESFFDEVESGWTALGVYSLTLRTDLGYERHAKATE